MNIFSSLGLTVYADKWVEDGRYDFTDEDKAAIQEAYVVPSEYGNSACFVMIGGGKSFIPMSVNASYTVGDTIDLDKAQIVTLKKRGEKDIYRVE